MSQPTRVFYSGDDVYYGYGPSPDEIEHMESVHRRGKEPLGRVVVFNKEWIRDAGVFSYDSQSHIQWMCLS